MAQNKKPTNTNTAKKAPAKKAAVKKAAPKSDSTPKKKPGPKKKPVEVALDIADDFVDREKLAELAKKVDDVVDQQKIEPAIEEAKEIVAEIVVNAEKKVSWLKKLLGKKNK